MPYKRIVALIAVLVFSVACTGCIGGGKDKDKTASKSRTRKKKNAGQNADHSRELDPYTPEGSMRRDLARIQEQERQQTKLVAQLRQNGDQTRLIREEERLHDLRGRVREYDTALQRYEMAARARPPRQETAGPSLVPEEMFRDRPVRNQTAYEDDYRPAYARAGQGGRGYAADPVVYQDDRVTHARLPLRQEQDLAVGGNRGAFQDNYIEEREQVLYNPMIDGNGQYAYADRSILTAPGSVPPAHMNGGSEREAPRQPNRQFAGAPVGASRYPAPAPRAAVADNRLPWETGTMYSNNSLASGERPIVPDVYASRRKVAEESVWPAGTAMAPPADIAPAQKQMKTTSVRLPENDLKPLPADPAPAATSTTSVKKSAPVDDFADDDVFNPDMFLGR